MELSDLMGKIPADAPFVATATATLDVAEKLEAEIEQLRQRCQALELENAALR
ncbi:MAG: hypothetical protein XU14_C0033G0034, partial [Armatimonadetes bacterium CSP1-3]